MVTMDMLVIDCGDDVVRPGDEVVLLGRQGDEEITAMMGRARGHHLVGDPLRYWARVPRILVD